jgi:hypothetical protein
MTAFWVVSLLLCVLTIVLANILDRKVAFFYAYKGWMCIGGGVGVVVSLFGIIFLS